MLSDVNKSMSLQKEFKTKTEDKLCQVDHEIKFNLKKIRYCLIS